MPEVKIPKCTNLFGFPRGAIGKSKNYARMVLKGNNEPIINNIFAKMMRLLDNKLDEYRLQSVSIGNHLFSNEIQARRANDASVVSHFGHLSHPFPPLVDSWLYPHYLL